MKTILTVFMAVVVLSACGAGLEKAAARPAEKKQQSSKPVDAGYNKYGHPIQSLDGKYIVKDEKNIRRTMVFDFDKAPADMFKPYKVEFKKLTNADFNGAATTEYTFKKCPDYDLKMEVDLPKEGEGPFPYIIWIHGGGWHGGDMYGHGGMSRFFASHGIAGIRISYSLSSKGGTFDDSWEDIKDAIQFIREHAGEWNLDNSNFGFAGHSAGGHLSAYTAMRTTGTKLLFAFNGIYDVADAATGFVPAGTHNEYFTGDYKKRQEASPYRYVHPGAPYTVLTYSSGDWLVDPQQVRTMEKALRENGVRHEVWEKDYYAHAGFIGGTDIYEETLLRMLELCEKFFK